MPNYLTPQELKTKSRLDSINMLSGFDDNLIQEVINEQQEIIRSYLEDRYDMEVEYAKTGDDRNVPLLSCLKVFSVHQMHARLNHQINESVELQYDRSLKWLKDVASGKASLSGLNPKHGEDSDGDGIPDGDSSLVSSNTKYPNKF
jgi:phage gp36-like protein